MKAQKAITSFVIAPCGMNCGICMAYLREKLHCPGCRASDRNKQKSCRACIIKHCKELKKARSKFCFKCPKFPCRRLKQLDKRYRTKYGMSMLENLDNIKKNGIRAFVRTEKKRWACKQCGDIVNVHRWACSSCGEERVNS